jgi:putative transposase
MRGLTACTEEEREEAMSKYEKIRGYLSGKRSQEEAALEGGVSVRTIQRWVKEYRVAGLKGLVKGVRKDCGRRREMSEEEVKVVEGLALRRPGRSVATVYREWQVIARKEGWKEQSYRTICRIVKEIGGAEMTLAQGGESV